MAIQTWTLTDTPRGIYQDTFDLSAAETPGSSQRWRVSKRTLRGGLQEGVDVVEIDNGRMLLVVLPTRGMGIWQAKIEDAVLGWRSPVRGPVHPAFVPIADPSGLGWLDGFDELVARCGLESNGAPDFNSQGQWIYPLHGRIANRPAHQVDVCVDDSAGTITVRGTVVESRFHFHKLRLVTEISTAFDSTAFTIHDQVENFSGAATEMQMLYHVNIGEPFLGPGAELVAPVATMAPRDAVAMEAIDTWNAYGPAVPGASEQVYYFYLVADGTGKTAVLLKDAQNSAGVTVRFRLQELPCFALWKNQVAASDGYVTGIEPATNFPNTRTFETEQGRVVRLAAGGTWSANVEIDWVLDRDRVRELDSEIRSLQGDRVPRIHPEPQTGWSP